jgi:hypothetical protein
MLVSENEIKDAMICMIEKQYLLIEGRRAFGDLFYQVRGAIRRE